jgi:hypothetical protein
MTLKFLQSYAFSPFKKHIILKFGLSSIDSCIIYLVYLQNVSKSSKKSVAEVSHIIFRLRTKKLIRLFGFDSRLKMSVNLLYGWRDGWLKKKSNRSPEKR